MQRTPIEWVKNSDGTQGYTWNPLTGCLHKCHYCYAHRIARRFGKTQGEKDFKPTFHPERLAGPQKIKKPSTIFVCSMADLFGDWVPMRWIEDVLAACRRAEHHRYIFLTKNPGRYREIDMPNYDLRSLNCLRGVTSEGELPQLAYGSIDFISFEPLLRKPDPTCFSFLGPFLKWVITGSQTGPGAVKPKKEWAKEIITACRDNGIPLFFKNNLLKIYPDLPKIQEVPWVETLINIGKEEL